MTILIWILIAAAADTPPPGAPPNNAPIGAKSEATVEETGLRQLLTIRRLYVDRLTGGETAAQMRDMLVSSLENTKLFIVTENQEKADCFLRGAAEDLVFTDVHTSSEGINARSNIGTDSAPRRAGGVYGRREIPPVIPADSVSERPNRAISKSANMRPSPRSGWSIRMATSSGRPRRRAGVASFTAPARMSPTASPRS